LKSKKSDYILIADSGSTKTSWALLSVNDNSVERFLSPGINPFYQDSNAINYLLNDLDFNGKEPGRVFFYGAGCVGKTQLALVSDALSIKFRKAQVEVESDLLGAARSLCGHESGIAAILGTGSNSCYYNGSNIIENVSPLGYILGDEGSGAVLGRKLLGDILKKQLPDNICKAFYEQYNLSSTTIIENVYRKPFPNRYLAKFTYFISEHIDNKSINGLVKSSFEDFFVRNISLYSTAHKHTIHFTGSVAWIFREILALAADESGFELGKVESDPIEGLLRYHINY